MKYTQEEKDAQAEEERKSKLIKIHEGLPGLPKDDLVGKDLVMGIDASVNIKELEEIAADFEKQYHQQRNAKKAVLEDLAKVTKVSNSQAAEILGLQEEIATLKNRRMLEDIAQIQSLKQSLKHLHKVREELTEHNKNQAQSLKAMKEEIVEWEANSPRGSAIDADMANATEERDRLHQHLSIYKTDLANARSENKTLRNLGTSLEQEIEVLKSPRDEGPNLVLIADLKKEVEIQSAKTMTAEIQLENWRKWAKTFPKIPKK